MEEKSTEHQESPPPTKMADQKIGYIWSHYHCQTSTNRYKAHELWRGGFRERMSDVGKTQQQRKDKGATYFAKKENTSYNSY